MRRFGRNVDPLGMKCGFAQYYAADDTPRHYRGDRDTGKRGPEPDPPRAPNRENRGGHAFLWCEAARPRFPSILRASISSRGAKSIARS